MQALQNGEKLNPDSSAVALLGMELLESGSAEVEPLVQRYINKNPSPQLRMAFARVLIGQKRPADAKAQIKAITSESPEFPEAWAVLANLQLQDKEYDEAEQSITQFAALQPRLPDGVARKAGQAQLYLLQADLAEKRKRYDEADAYLQLIPDAPNLLSVQARRADLLARQGKIRKPAPSSAPSRPKGRTSRGSSRSPKFSCCAMPTCPRKPMRCRPVCRPSSPTISSWPTTRR